MANLRKTQTCPLHLGGAQKHIPGTIHAFEETEVSRVLSCFLEDSSAFSLLTPFLECVWHPHILHESIGYTHPHLPCRCTPALSSTCTYIDCCGDQCYLRRVNGFWLWHCSVPYSEHFPMLSPTEVDCWVSVIKSAPEGQRWVDLVYREFKGIQSYTERTCL